MSEKAKFNHAASVETDPTLSSPIPRRFGSDLWRIFRLLDSTQRRWFFVVLAFMAFSALLQVVSVASIYPFLSVVADPDSIQTGWLSPVYKRLGFSSFERFLAVLALVVFFLTLLSNLVIFLERWLLAKFRHGLNHSLSVRLFKTYLFNNYSFFLKRHSSELQKNVVMETDRVAGLLVGASLNLLSSLLIGTGLIVLLLFANPLVTLVVIGIIGGGDVVAYYLLRSRFKKLSQSYLQKNKERHKIVLESFGGIKDLKLFGRENAFVARYEPQSRGWANDHATWETFQHLPKFFIESLSVGGLLAGLGLLILMGEPVGALIPLMGLFVFAGYRLMPVFREVLNAVAAFRFNEAIFTLIEEDLESGRQGLHNADESIGPLSFRESLSVENLTFYYPNTSTVVLKNITLKIPKNSSVAFVGETGAGKTTLVDLILGLYEPQEGAVRVDGVVVKDHVARRWQKIIGYVPQEIFLMDDTVRNNIAFGLRPEEIDDVAVERAAEIAHIRDFVINDLPEGYNTIIGERGVLLSGGQRQRIGIARALYHNPEVLVLDEATSDIDQMTEVNITNAIEELARKKTIIVIAHRLSTIQKCHRIYVLDRGRIVGEGTYDELAAQNRRFMDLARIAGPVVQA